VTTKSQFVVVPRDLVDLAYTALDDARTEIEEFEKQVSWYTASQKMMDRIEKAMKGIKEAIR
jgi:hypothetical protein